jgi:hypothetical protein
MKKSQLLKQEDLEFLLRYSLSFEVNWKVLIGSPDDTLNALITDTFSDDKQVRVITVHEGCDLLVSAAIESPDLLIIEEGLADLSPEIIIRCMKKNKILEGIRIFSCLKSGNIKAPVWGADDFITRDNLDKIYLARKVSSLPFNSSSRKKKGEGDRHERRWPRIRVKMGAILEIRNADDAKSLRREKAVIEDIGPGGACISQITFDENLLSGAPLHLHLKVEDPPLTGIQAESLVIRVQPQGTAGIKFLEMSRSDRNRIMDMFNL